MSFYSNAHQHTRSTSKILNSEQNQHFSAPHNTRVFLYLGFRVSVCRKISVSMPFLESLSFEYASDQQINTITPTLYLSEQSKPRRQMATSSYLHLSNYVLDQIKHTHGHVKVCSKALVQLANISQHLSFKWHRRFCEE